MKQKLVILNVILVPLILFLDIFYMINGEVITKAIASLTFVITGVINFIYCIKNNNDLNYPKWMLYALICTMIGDIVLEFNFILGTIIFAMGHILYFKAYSKLEKTKVGDFKYGIVISLIVLPIVLYNPFLFFKDNTLKMVCCFYAIIISMMVGKAISNLLIKNNNITKVVLLGSILFLTSDAMLLLDIFGSIPLTGYICLSTYYPAQFLLALSILIYSNNNLIENNEYLEGV